MQGNPSNLHQRNIDITPVKKTLLKLLNKSLNKEILNEKEKKFIIDVIKINPQILKEIGFSPESMFELIEYNESLANEILFFLSSYEGFENYMALFLIRKWSVNSMKVINKLIQRIAFPPEFISSYLKYIIIQFKNETNVYTKERLGKIFGFFILNLLNHNHITIDMIPPSINLLFNEEYNDKEILLLRKKIYEYRRNKNNI
jgi:hypothetical protein